MSRSRSGLKVAACQATSCQCFYICNQLATKGHAWQLRCACRVCKDVRDMQKQMAIRQTTRDANTPDFRLTCCRFAFSLVLHIACKASSSVSSLFSCAQKSFDYTSVLSSKKISWLSLHCELMSSHWCQTTMQTECVQEWHICFMRSGISIGQPPFLICQLKLQSSSLRGINLSSWLSKCLCVKGAMRILTQRPLIPLHDEGMNTLRLRMMYSLPLGLAVWPS